MIVGQSTAAAGVVVGMGRHLRSTRAVQWGITEADLRGWPLCLVHAWEAPLDLTVEISPASLPGLIRPALCQAVQGTAARTLSARPAGLLVLGTHGVVRHGRYVAQACVQRATCPVVMVPDTGREQTGRIVVGVSGAEASRMALVWAAAEAMLRRAELVVVQASQPYRAPARHLLRRAHAPAAGPSMIDERLGRWVGDVLDAELGIAPPELHSGRGGADDVLRVAADADLIVVDHDVRGPLKQLVHGTFDNDVRGLASTPVVVMPQRGEVTARVRRTRQTI